VIGVINTTTVHNSRSPTTRAAAPRQPVSPKCADGVFFSSGAQVSRRRRSARDRQWVTSFRGTGFVPLISSRFHRRGPPDRLYRSVVFRRGSWFWPRCGHLLSTPTLPVHRREAGQTPSATCLCHHRCEGASVGALGGEAVGEFVSPTPDPASGQAPTAPSSKTTAKSRSSAQSPPSGSLRPRRIGCTAASSAPRAPCQRGRRLLRTPQLTTD
jgi:hypothetical protein